MAGNLIRRQVYTVKTPTGVTMLYDIDQALQITKDRVPELAATDQMPDMQEIRQAYADLNRVHAMQTRLGPESPGIVGTESGLFRLLDGWHRLYKSHVTGAPDYWFVVMTEEETKRCLIGRYEPDQNLQLMVAMALLMRGDDPRKVVRP